MRKFFESRFSFMTSASMWPRTRVGSPKTVPGCATFTA
jgi:hypothetical protein